MQFGCVGHKQHLLRTSMKHKITICMGSSCFSRGNEDNLELIESFVRNNNLDADIELVGSRCESKCARGPVITVGSKTLFGVDSGTLLDVLNDMIA